MNCNSNPESKESRLELVLEIVLTIQINHYVPLNELRICSDTTTSPLISKTTVKGLPNLYLKLY